MGFYPQPNDWSCGPFALKHALVALGQMASESEIAKHARTHWWSGTDEIRLAKAARAYGCELRYVRHRDPERARKELIAALRRGPVLLCVDDWGHWIAVLRHHQGTFVVVDSDLDPVLNLLTWTKLRRRWRYLDTDYDDLDPPELYDLYAVKPRFRAPMRADFSVTRVKHLRRASNQDLAEHWNSYLDDLLAICRPRHNRMLLPLSMAEFLRRHQDLIVSRTDYWHGDVEPTAVKQLLSKYRFVAETYGLVIPRAASRRAVADIAILATLWIATTRGVGPMYGSGE